MTRPGIVAAMLAGAMAMGGATEAPRAPSRRAPTPTPIEPTRRRGRVVNSGGNAIKPQQIHKKVEGDNARPELSRKAEFIEQARRAGWKGKSYRKAQQFERKLTRLGGDQ